MDCGGKRSATPLSHARRFNFNPNILRPPESGVAAPALPPHSKTPPVFRASIVTHHANAFAVASKLAASATFSICPDLSMRFMKPLKAVPGPNSMNRV